MHPQLIPVPFYEDTVVLVGQDNEPFVAMKPIVENIGLAWQVQHRKLSASIGRWGITIMVIPSLGGPQEVLGLPLRKLASWLMTISPNKVKPELRDKIIRYQEECDDALWDYWTKGSVSRTGSSTANQQVALSRHRVSLLKELYKTRDNGLRAALYDQLAQISNQLGLPTPLIETIGKAAPMPNEKLDPFWRALLKLDEAGEPYNHSATPTSVLAINFKDLQTRLDKHRCGLIVDLALRKLLAESVNPRFVESNKNVCSVLLKKTVRCMVFDPRE